MPQLPALTPEQSAAGLAKAKAAGKARVEAKAELTAGTLSLAAVVTGEDSRLQRAYVRQVLEALPGVGKVRAAADDGRDRHRREAPRSRDSATSSARGPGGASSLPSPHNQPRRPHAPLLCGRRGHNSA